MLCWTQLCVLSSIYSQEIILSVQGVEWRLALLILLLSLETATFELKLPTLVYIHGISVFSRKTGKCSLNFLLVILQYYKSTSFLSVDTRKDLKTWRLHWVCPAVLPYFCDWSPEWRSALNWSPNHQRSFLTESIAFWLGRLAQNSTYSIHLILSWDNLLY